MKKKILGLVTLATVLTVGLAACGSKDSGKKDSGGGKEKAATEEKIFPEMIDNKDDSLEGGTLKVAMPYDTQFKGVFSYSLYEDAYDGMLLGIAEQFLFNTDETYKYNDTGLASIKVDKEAKTVTIDLKKDLKWSDGEPLTADDVIYSYEVVGHKDYTGVRYDDRLQNIVGMTEYHDGAENISGIKKVNDLQVVITYKEMSPSIEYGSGLIQYAMPKHYLSDVAIADLQTSDKIRKNPVTTGPYSIANIKAGESVEYVANKNYFKGAPKLEKIIVTVVPNATIVDELKAKKYDVALDMPSDTYPTYKEIAGYQNVGREELYYSYIGFKFGEYDKEKGESISNPKAKMNDKALREAIAYSIDTKQLGEKVYDGLRTPANSVIIPAFKGAHDTSIEAFAADEDKAKKILDDAGYKDTDDDGFREDKQGKKLTINFAAMSGTESAQTVADYLKQSMENIGLKVEFTTGRLMELNSFYDKILGDADDVDMYAAAWGVGTDPNPSESFSRSAQYNMSRYTSPKMDKVLSEITSKEAFDEDFSNEAYSEFQKLVKKEIPVIPLNYNYRVSIVNDRVKGYNYGYQVTEEIPNNWFGVSVTADKTK